MAWSEKAHEIIEFSTQLCALRCKAGTIDSPVNLNRLAKYFNLEVHSPSNAIENKLAIGKFGCAPDGRYRYSDGGTGGYQFSELTVSAGHSRLRQKMSVAHALGYIFNHASSNTNFAVYNKCGYAASTPDEPDLEKAAKKFGYELVMPFAHLHSAAIENNFVYDVRKIATAMDVPVVSMIEHSQYLDEAGLLDDFETPELYTNSRPYHAR